MVYMDNAATTRMHPKVVEAMLPYLKNMYGNPSGVYNLSKSAKRDVERARATIAQTINALPEEIYFTSGGTEGDNWAIKNGGLVTGRRGHIITSEIEHNAVLQSCRAMEAEGVQVSYVKCNSEGIIYLNMVENSIMPNTCMISVMAANNEIGTVQPIAEIGAIASEYGILFHTDAVQAYTNMDIDVRKMNISMLSASGHKIKGPKGVGFLYVKKGTGIQPFISGGSQENGMRAGTENVAGIVGLAKAAEIACNNRLARNAYEVKLRNYMTDRILRQIPGCRLNGHRVRRLPGNMNFVFENTNGPRLVALLDQYGICVSAGSACSYASSKPSHVLTAIGLRDELAHSAVRFSINDNTTKGQVDYVVDCLKKAVATLRQ